MGDGKEGLRCFHCGALILNGEGYYGIRISGDVPPGRDDMLYAHLDHGGDDGRAGHIQGQS